MLPVSDWEAASVVVSSRVSVHCEKARLDVVATSIRARAVKSRKVFIDRGFATNLTKNPMQAFDLHGVRS